MTGYTAVRGQRLLYGRKWPAMAVFDTAALPVNKVVNEVTGREKERERWGGESAHSAR